MDNPLRYQMTEYDCGPTSLLNGVSFLFHRAELPPELVRNVMLYCLDSYGPDGVSGKRGTSGMAMMFLSNWLNGFGRAGRLPVGSRYLSGREVNLSQNGPVLDTLHRGGAVVALVDLDGGHYVLLTGVRENRVLLFDPYYRAGPFADPNLEMVSDHPADYNRIIPAHYLERESRAPYAFGPQDSREAVLLFNETTRLTAEDTVEYFI